MYFKNLDKKQMILNQNRYLFNNFMILRIKYISSATNNRNTKFQILDDKIKCHQCLKNARML